MNDDISLELLRKTMEAVEMFAGYFGGVQITKVQYAGDRVWFFKDTDLILDYSRKEILNSVY